MYLGFTHLKFKINEYIDKTVFNKYIKKKIEINMEI